MNGFAKNKSWLASINRKTKKFILTITKKKYIKIFTIFTCLSLFFFPNSNLITVHDMQNGNNIDIDKFFHLKEKPINPNDPLILIEKENLLNFFSNYSRHNITKVNTIYLGTKARLGNQLILLSKVIFFCEILGCKSIILDKHNWFIKNKIYYEKYNMTIQTMKKLFFGTQQIINDISYNWLFYFSYIKPELRIDVIKKEIMNNIPKINVNPKDVFIHIRSGDIFQKSEMHNEFYSQPPLCFYQTILNEFDFKNIYIISENKFNPIIDQLIVEYPNIIFKENEIEIDMAYLINAYNIVGSISTFINMLIRLNNNLKYFWEYNLPNITSKIIHCHHSFFKPFKNVTYFSMEPSENYKKIMKNWNNSNLQLETMLNDKCIKKFSVYHDIYSNKSI